MKIHSKKNIDERTQIVYKSIEKIGEIGMSKFDGKEHEEFFSKFMKATIITSVLIIILLAVLWFFLIY